MVSTKSIIIPPWPKEYNQYEERKYICDCSVVKDGVIIEAHKHHDHVFAGGCKLNNHCCSCTGYSQKKQIKNPDYHGD